MNIMHLGETDETEFRGESLLRRGRPLPGSGEPSQGFKGQENRDFSETDAHADPEMRGIGDPVHFGEERVLAVERRESTALRVLVHNVVMDEQG